ncbi:MAG: arginyl-tRNA synthetase [Verrucomicrobiales bacterium]|jgi:arginyl-tRNA synthetase
MNLTPIDHLLSAWAQTAVAAAFPDAGIDPASITASRASVEGFGDYQCNAAMPLAKTLKLAPRKIAEQIAAYTPLPDAVEKVDVAGPGFINFYLKTDWLSQRAQDLLADERLGVLATGAGKTIVIDYSSPNVAKPMHIGHIRSTVIGNALDRMHRYAGYTVVADNHLGDWGTQFGLMIMGYRNFVDEAALKTDAISELERIYVKSYNASKEDETWLESAKAELVKLQQGDAENLALWRSFVELSIAEFNRIYDRLDVRFDAYRGESFYNDALPGVLAALEAKGLLIESDGAKIVNLEDEKLGVAIVQKSDGAFNYTTTDLATVQRRVADYQPEAIIYVTDERQQLHFKQFFHVSQLLGCPARLVHVWFGLMRLPEATFSTREGNVIKLEALLDEAESRALEMAKSKSPEMSEAHQQEVAQALGIGAIKYTDLSQNPQSLVTFTWEKALDTKGNSAPYLQYTYARNRSVLDKYAARFPDSNLDDYGIRIEEEAERKLVVKAAQFNEVFQSALVNYRPNMLADYLYELAQLNSSFYQNLPKFLETEEGLRESRMKLCLLVAALLRRGLDLMGIRTPERI